MALAERLRVGDHGPHVFQPGAGRPNQNVADGDDHLGPNLQRRLMDQQVEVASDGPFIEFSIATIASAVSPRSAAATAAAKSRSDGATSRHPSAEGPLPPRRCRADPERGCEAGGQCRIPSPFTDVAPQV